MTAPSPPPRDPLVEVAEKIMDNLHPEAGTVWCKSAADRYVLPILRAFVEEREKACQLANDLIVKQGNDLAAASAEADEERRLRATACKLADERERENADNVKNGYQTIGGMAQRLRDKDTAFWRMKTRLIRTARRILRQCITAEAERDRAQEKLREAEGLLAATLDADADLPVEKIRAFLHPDEQPAAPADESWDLPQGFVRGPDTEEPEECAGCGQDLPKTGECQNCKTRAYGPGGKHLPWCEIVGCRKPPNHCPCICGVDAPPAPRTEAPPSERHKFTEHGDYNSGECYWTEKGLCHFMIEYDDPDVGGFCGKPESDPCHAEEDVWERFVREKHADPVHQAAKHECGIVGPHERDDYCPPDTRPDEREEQPEMDECPFCCEEVPADKPCVDCNTRKHGAGGQHYGWCESIGCRKPPHCPCTCGADAAPAPSPSPSEEGK